MAEKQIRHKVKTKKNVKKSFYEVPTSLTATKIYLYSSSAEELNNKTAVLDLTKSLRGKSLLLKIRIKNTDGKLQGVPESASLAQSYIKRVAFETLLLVIINGFTTAIESLHSALKESST